MMLEWLGLPAAASAHAGDIDRVIALVHWLMAILFVGWGSFFAFVLLRFRRSRNPSASYTGLQNRWPKWAEAGVLIAEVVLLAFFSVPAWSQRVDAFPQEQQSTVVRVIAEQFAWNVHYPGGDGRFGRTALDLVTLDNPLGLDTHDPAAADDVITTNEMRLPVGRPAIIYLSSKDVVHSFGLPQMRVKQDAIPGLVQPVWFTPTRTGEWEIVCSQLCGLGHYRMKGFYTIQAEPDYESWLESQSVAHRDNLVATL